MPLSRTAFLPFLPSLDKLVHLILEGTTLQKKENGCGQMARLGLSKRGMANQAILGEAKIV